LPIPGTNCVFGVDFWRAFGLAPAVVGKPVTRGVNAAEEIHASQMEHCADLEDEDEVKEEPESWSLSAEEKLALGKVKEEFLTFERDTTVVSEPGKGRFCWMHGN